jgi:hypothetical protein
MSVNELPYRKNQGCAAAFRRSPCRALALGRPRPARPRCPSRHRSDRLIRRRSRVHAAFSSPFIVQLVAAASRATLRAVACDRLRRPWTDPGPTLDPMPRALGI